MANNFSTDSSCYADWEFVSGALATDSKGGNTLTLVGSPVEGSIYPPGLAASLALNGSSQYAYIPDGSLPTGFPWKSTDIVMQGTVSCWIYANSFPNYPQPWSKYNNAVTSGLVPNCTSGSGALNFGWCHGGSLVNISTGLTLSTGVWYHLTCIIDGVNKILKIILYNASTGAVSYFLNNPANPLTAYSADWQIGNSGIYGSANDDNYWDGWISQLVVFNRLLSLGEILKIINQAYTGPYAAASPGNNFSGDSRFQARWRFEAGALETDSIGTNTLTANGSPTADPLGVQEGADAANLGAVNSCFSIADSALSANFPWKTTGNNQGTLCGWFIFTGLDNSGSTLQALWGKGPESGYGGVGAFVAGGGLGGTAGDLTVLINSTFYDTGFAIPTMVPLHIAFVIDGVGLTLKVRVYNYITGIATDYGPFTITAPSLGTYTDAFALGNSTGRLSTFIVYTMGGWLDEVVVANALLSDAEIDEIREETYALVTTITGTVAAILAQEAAAIAGTPLVTGAATPSLSQVLASLAGSPLVSGAVSALLTQAAADLEGSPVISASLAPLLAAAYADLEGSPVASAALSALLTQASTDVEGTPEVTGGLTALLSQVEADFEGTPIIEIIVATVAAVLAAVTADAEGTPIVTGDISTPLNPLAIEIAGSPIVTGTLAALIEQVAAEIEGTPITITGVIVATLAVITAAMEGTPVVEGAMEPVLPAVIASIIVLLAAVQFFSQIVLFAEDIPEMVCYSDLPEIVLFAEDVQEMTVHE